MSQEDVDVVRQLGEALNCGDVDACVESFARDAELHEPADVPGAQAHCGHDEIRRFFEGLARFWSEFRIEPVDLRDVRDRVLVHGRVVGRGRASGLEVGREFHLVATLRDRRILEMRYYTRKAEALEAVGLRE